MGWLGDRDHTRDGLQAVLIAAILGIVGAVATILVFLRTGTTVTLAAMGVTPGPSGAVVGVTSVIGAFAGRLVGLMLTVAWISFVIERNAHGDAHRRNVILASAIILLSAVGYAVALAGLFPSPSEVTPTGPETTTLQTGTVLPSIILATGVTTLTAVAFVAFLHELVAPRRRPWLFGYLVLAILVVAVTSAGYLSLPPTLDTIDDLGVLAPYFGAARGAALGGYVLLLVALWPTYRDWDGAPTHHGSGSPARAVDLPCPRCETEVRIRPDRVESETLTCPRCGFRGKLPASLVG